MFRKFRGLAIVTRILGRIHQDHADPLQTRVALDQFTHLEARHLGKIRAENHQVRQDPLHAENRFDPVVDEQRT